ncbi:histidine phosphatase family protein [Aurantimonas sp. MSK8Z-1]|uniref:SixA phosphatase family protein n=1 Tax=Mangrovibrevibacter kandeliae TaxID=2968473 RepID=UPI0021181B37|nr:histidine phosphatase family protein [Aurantimonas sp. MSK8Z-1]MCW4114411.1 histidine phosphatase family protein [Aurantimonas sp. MSK8Z-1]
MVDTVQPTLMLLRHAHSSWDVAGQRDHDRPLDERGRRDAEDLGKRMAADGLRFEAVFCSTAVRARETLQAVLGNTFPSAAVEWREELYALGEEAYYAAVRSRPQARLTLVVGHNPMVAAFAASLAGSGEPQAVAALENGYPTAALAVLRSSLPLGELAPGCCHLIRLIRPKDGERGSMPTL